MANVIRKKSTPSMNGGRRDMSDQESRFPAEQESGQDDQFPPEENDRGDVLTEAELNEMIENLCISKAEEFRMLGYEQVTGKEVWECVNEKYQKKGIPPLHQIVNDILSLKSTSFMNWMTMSIYKKAQF